jgi:hypothetical protein
MQALLVTGSNVGSVVSELADCNPSLPTYSIAEDNLPLSMVRKTLPI